MECFKAGIWLEAELRDFNWSLDSGLNESGEDLGGGCGMSLILKDDQDLESWKWEGTFRSSGAEARNSKALNCRLRLKEPDKIGGSLLANSSLKRPGSLPCSATYSPCVVLDESRSISFAFFTHLTNLIVLPHKALWASVIQYTNDLMTLHAIAKSQKECLRRH